MGFFYFDESIQEKGGFIIGAFVYCEVDLTPAVFNALADVGLRPGIDEFKSGARMVSHPEQTNLRESLRLLLQGVRIGVLVAPVSDRPRLGNEAITVLAKILNANALTQVPHHVFIDQQITFDNTSLEAFRKGVGVLCEVHAEQDSRAVGGIQVADLAAHSLGIMLLEHQGLLKRMVKAGENSGYEPELEIELGFELWASLRYSFFKAPQPKQGSIPDDPVGDTVFDVENYGLRIADTCGDALRTAALERFGECYLGCIH